MLRLTVFFSILILGFVIYRVGQNYRSLVPTGNGMDIKALKIVDIEKGSGSAVEMGSKVQVQYRAWIYDPTKKDRHGEQIDSSYDRNKPMEVTIGLGQIVPSWEEGLLGLREGGRRIIYSPSTKAYGEPGVKGVIPADQAIIYEVELVKIL